METPTEVPRVQLKPKEHGRLQDGHLWAFSNEIADAPPNATAGMVADLVQAGGGFLGRGFYNPNTLVAFRILTPQKEDVDERLFTRRLLNAQRLREKVYPGQTAYRWVFGESDRLPGLIIDRYGDVVAIQAVSAGMDRLQDLIVSVVDKLLRPRAIVWRCDTPLREMEGLMTLPSKVVAGSLEGPVEIETENGTFLVDVLSGQKTGFYFDQRDNRQALAAYCRDQRVLDAFCYSGGFGIAAGRAGARQVVFVDSSHAALQLAAANAERNGLAGRYTCVEGDVEALLAAQSPGGSFDVISIDPPAYARAKKHLPAALKAYERLNTLAMKALPREGFLASSSCSHHVTRDAFAETLRRAARRAQRQVRLLEWRAQSKDHPGLLGMPETEYLKCLIMQIA